MEELFEWAALGMLSIMVDPSCVVGRKEAVEISLGANDIEGLMFEWLNELLFIMDSEGVLLSEFEVDAVSDLHLEATARGEKVEPDRHRLMTGIKAATFHQLKVERQADTWFARVIFDV